MSLLGWVVGAMVLDAFGRQQDEIEDHDHALREKDRRINDLESRLRRLEQSRTCSWRDRRSF